MGRPDEAKSVYETALAYDSNNADLHYNIGVVHIELGHVDQAQEDFTKALQVFFAVI
jgi:Tfp pilus assembly protein PilF